MTMYLTVKIFITKYAVYIKLMGEIFYIFIHSVAAHQPHDLCPSVAVKLWLLYVIYST